MKKIVFGMMLLVTIQCVGGTVEYVKVTVSNSTEYLEISENQICTLMTGGQGAGFEMGTTGVEFGIEPINDDNIPPVSGPGTVRITSTTHQEVYVFKIETKDGVMTPSGSVVIPSDRHGPVQIKLECSSDMVNWIDALPGTYETGASNRFFRIKGLRDDG